MESEYPTYYFILFGILLFGAVIFYFIPSFVASEKYEYKWLIFIVNMLFGWTVIGWVGALIWAVTTKKRKIVYQTVSAEPDKYDKLSRLKDLLDSGAISEEEYQSEKSKILSGLQTEWNIKS